MASKQYSNLLEVCKQLHTVHNSTVKLHSRSWGDGSGFLKVLPWVQDLVQSYHAKSMLEVGAGRNLQMTPLAHFDYKKNTYSPICTVLDFLNLSLYTQYDPAVPGIDQWPNSEFDCTVIVMVLDNIPDNDFAWWLKEISKRTKKFCLICENLYPNLDTDGTFVPNFLNSAALDLHLLIAENISNRTYSFYKKILTQYWCGPDLYFLHSPTFPPTQSWMADSLLK
jgi:hypothetical protein